MRMNVLLVYVFVPWAGLVTVEIRGHQISWNWNYTPQKGCWAPKLDPLQERQLLLTTEASISPAPGDVINQLLEQCYK